MSRELLEKRAVGPDTTSKIWGGAIAAGAGIGLLGVLYDTVRSQRRRTKAETGSDPDAIYVNLPGPEMAKMSMISEPLIGFGLGGLSAYGIYEFYKKWKQDQLRQEIEDAAGGYTKSLYEDVDDDDLSIGINGKKANNLIWEMLKDAPRDAFFLPGIAAGVGTYGLLNSTFPKVKEKTAPGTPRKIIVRGFGRVNVDNKPDGPLADMDKENEKRKIKAMEAEAPPVPDAPEEEIAERPWWRKAASFEFSRKDNLHAAELLCLTLANHPDLKEASSPLLEILGGYHEDPGAVRSAVKSAGFLGAISTLKGASETFNELPELDKRATVHRALRDPIIQPGLTLLAIAEYGEVSPGHAKMAFNVAEDTSDLPVLVTKFASVFHVLETGTWLSDNQVEKTATYADFMDDASDNLGTLDLASSQDSDGENERTSPEELYRGNQDPIDKLMAPK
jgi:hypothetical protein